MNECNQNQRTNEIIENQKETIRLLEEIRDFLSEIRDQKFEENYDEDDEDKEAYTCDKCNENFDDKPYIKINVFDFCSSECYSNWKKAKE